jgi:thiol-disulfide isomerase/thioredoxin
MKFVSLFLLLCCGVLRASPVPPHPAPAWVLRDADGKAVSSAKYKGKVVVVDFWATWCVPCRSEIPGYVALQSKYRDSGLVIVGMAVNDTEDFVKAFVADHHVNYQVVMADEAVARAFGGDDGIQGIPTTFIINRDGMIVDRKEGALRKDEFEKLLLRVLNPPPQASSSR